MVVAIDLYYASVEDLETISCFFDLQEIKASPRNTQYPVKDFLVSRQLTQFASQNAISYKSESTRKNTP